MFRLRETGPRARSVAGKQQEPGRVKKKVTKTVQLWKDEEYIGRNTVVKTTRMWRVDEMICAIVMDI